MQFVLASHNKKKLEELSTILGGLGIEVIPLPEDAPEPEENGKTFEENARIKALAAHQHTGLPAIADDSGLAVDALSGAPGVYSARYCSGSDADRNLFLLKNMEHVDECERQARFVCTICCILPDGQEIVVRGECEGEILTEQHGTGGFGYDPLFYVREYDCTFAELPAEVKNRISHRAHALEKLAAVLRKKLKSV
ncbi:MAG: RdgB/HAM1 family non-canonical purine NTP pyrophosphatase [Butyricicoccus pullicaecorum]|nr:RdgB/HAM1 family non-canonical purine NTP pyrophosphatase [Butyricicoccus pullicaecorum]